MFEEFGLIDLEMNSLIETNPIVEQIINNSAYHVGKNIPCVNLQMIRGGRKKHLTRKQAKRACSGWGPPDRTGLPSLSSVICAIRVIRQAQRNKREWTRPRSRCN